MGADVPKSPKKSVISHFDIVKNPESQRKAAADMTKLARKMKSEAIRIRKQLHRTA